MTCLLYTAEDLKNWKKNCDFVELSHEFSPDTPHWSGFPAMNAEMIFDYPDVFRVHIVQVATQYGTHVDAPAPVSYTHLIFSPLSSAIPPIRQ